MARLLEHHAKDLLECAGIPTPRRESAKSPLEAASAAARLGGQVVVKALVPSNRRAKAGGVRFADDADGAGQAAASILGSVFEGRTVGRAGETVDDIPIFDTVSAAAVETGGPFDASIVYVPPLAALGAAEEALAADVRFLLVVTENVSAHDSIRLLARARERGAAVIGPNSVGVIEPARRLKLGAIGGDSPDRAFEPGHVAILSRSGGLTVEVALQLRLAGLGVSTAVSIGGDAMIGTSPAVLYRRLLDDDETAAVVYVGEPGTGLEAELADTIAETGMPKPLVALILGRFMEDFPRGAVFGHAGAVIGRSDDAPSAKLRRLEQAGAFVAESIEDALRPLQSQLEVEVRP